MGFWNTILISVPRTARISRSLSVRRSRPSNTIRPFVMKPGGEGMRRRVVPQFEI